MSFFPSRPSEVLPFLKQSPVSQGLAIRFGGIVLAFLQAILLARLVAPDVYGAYAVGMSFAALLGAISCLGLAQLSVRNVPKLCVEGDPRGFMRRTTHIVLAASGALTVGTALAVYLAPSMGSGILRYAVLLAVVLIPLLALLRLNAAYLRGLRAPSASQAAEFLFRPLVFVPALILLASISRDLTLPILFAVSALATAFALGASLVLRFRRAHLRPAGRPTPSTGTGERLREALPFFVSSVAMIAQTEVPTLILGVVAGATEAGLLQPVLRIGMILALGHVVVSHPLAPRVAALWHKSDLPALRVTVRRAARKSLVLTAPVCVTVIVFSEEILLIFGERFVVGAPGLAALAIAQLINSLTGFGGILLGMTNYQSVATKVNLLSLATILLAVTWAASAFGANGAACAIAFGVILTNVLYLYHSLRLTGVNGTVFCWNRMSGRGQD